MRRTPYWLILVSLIVLALLLSGCGGSGESADTQTAAATATAVATFTPTAPPTPAPTTPPTATPQPTLPPVTPTRPVTETAAELEAQAKVNLGLDASTPGEGIAGVHAIPLKGGPTDEKLWLVYTYGLRSLDPEQFHLLVIYSQNERGWHELASQELSPATPGERSPDFIDEGAVRQVQVEPTNWWIEVEDGVGDQGGLYALYRFDGKGFKREAFASNTHPDAGHLDDLNGDGVPEVVLDVSDYAVFCAACGVRYAQYAILRWDGTHMTTVTLQPLADSAPAALREANDAAISLATAGLWKDAVAAVDQGMALNSDDPIFEWNAVYIQYNAEAKANALAEGGQTSYPLLDNLFYGDYAAAVDVMRAYPPAELFNLRTPLILGTPAEGAAQQLANRILSGVEPVLKVRPDLAAAYYLRGWANFLKSGFADETVLADVERATQLAADDRLFADTVVYFGGDPSTLSLAAPPAGGATAPTTTLSTTLTATVAASSTTAVVVTAPLTTGVTSTVTAPVTTALTSTLTAPVASGGSGQIYFSALDADGHNAIFVVAATAGAQPTLVMVDATQPAVQPGGARLAFHSTRKDMLGLGASVLSTGERLRFSYNVEDAVPTWAPAGDQLFFASTRYGDGRWRLYQVWADGNGNATDMRYGQDPAWHPTTDSIVYKGCDEAGGHCGLWLIRADGNDRHPLTDNPGDARPRWSPDGNTVVFMSDQRDGNWELYTLDVASGTVSRLTENPANDGLPVVSPDGTTVAFLSDRDGAWAIWSVPLAGGTAGQLVPVGQLPDWLDQGLDWVASP